MNRGTAHTPRGFGLAVREMIGIEQPQRLGRPFTQVASVALEGLHPADVDFPRSKGVHRPSSHWASAMPAPPADWMPMELYPAATQKFASSGTSPR